MDSKTKNSIVLGLVTLTVLVFFISGVFNVLHYKFIKYSVIGLLLCFGLTIGYFLFYSSLKKNHPEDELQDDNN